MCWPKNNKSTLEYPNKAHCIKGRIGIVCKAAVHPLILLKLTSVIPPVCCWAIPSRTPSNRSSAMVLRLQSLQVSCTCLHVHTCERPVGGGGPRGRG